MNRVHRQGFTLIELTVVLLILTILASISISVYSGFTQRARVARAHVEIEDLAFNIARYQTDLGVLPPSFSNSTVTITSPPFVATPKVAFNQIPGNGLMMLALMRGIVGTPAGALTGAFTTEPLWHGPYIEVNQVRLIDPTGAPINGTTTNAGDVCLADPWGKPYSYVNNADYLIAQATLIINSPFQGMLQFYNPTTFQIYSAGPNGITITGTPNEAGLESDDINNYNSQ